MNRRHFIKNTALATSILSYFESYAEPIFQPQETASPLKIFATNWGFEGSTDAFCEKAKAAGYDGIELWWSHNPSTTEDLFKSLKKYELEIGFLIGDGSPDFNKNLENFNKSLKAVTSSLPQKPRYINCHSGKDYFSFEQNSAFIEATTAASKQTGLTICHETHRGRILFNAPLCRQFIEKHPNLKLTADLSHWCCVHESLLKDQKDTLDLALSRTEHIHARIGHAQGPQVNDPRAPEWAAAVEAHFSWWDKVVERKRKANETVTILTEFGPPDYLPTLPYTRQPIANQWDINVYMMQVLRKRYS